MLECPDKGIVLENTDEANMHLNAWLRTGSPPKRFSQRIGNSNRSWGRNSRGDINGRSSGDWRRGKGRVVDVPRSGERWREICSSGQRKTEGHALATKRCMGTNKALMKGGSESINTNVELDLTNLKTPSDGFNDIIRSDIPSLKSDQTLVGPEEPKKNVTSMGLSFFDVVKTNVGKQAPTKTHATKKWKRVARKLPNTEPAAVNHNHINKIKSVELGKSFEENRVVSRKKEREAQLISNRET
ncbi:hypothetical protein QYF36_015853 [Acer negundo]|nr:hypothetical protein QYF36_015853 [Acer negundo]